MAVSLLIAAMLAAGSVALAHAAHAGLIFVQAGADIDGEAEGDHSGAAVALSADGNRVAVGAYGNSGWAGHVRLFDWDGAEWVQVGADIDGEASGDSSGLAVALSAEGHRVAIGAPDSSGSGDGAGQVRVFDWDGGEWVQVGADIDGGASGDSSGLAVALSADGNRVAIGAPSNDGAGVDAGHVRVFDWDGVSWVQAGPDIDGEVADDRLGRSVALSADGNRVVIGALEWLSGDRAGYVRVLDWDGSTWMQAGADIDGEAAGDHAGLSVSTSADGDRVAIGGGHSSGSDGAGHVRVFDWDGATWVQAGVNINGEAAGDGAGWDVALSADGNRVAVGAPDNDGSGESAGHVRVFDWDGSTWVQAGADIDGEAAGDSSGWAVASSADGGRVAIGAVSNAGSGISAGHVRIFDVTVSPATTTTTTTTTLATTTTAVTPGGGTLPETGIAGIGFPLAGAAIACGVLFVAAARRRTN